jgi:hypothetical protein
MRHHPPNAPEAGCTVTVTVEDRGTGLRDTRTVPMTNPTN